MQHNMKLTRASQDVMPAPFILSACAEGVSKGELTTVRENLAIVQFFLIRLLTSYIRCYPRSSRTTVREKYARGCGFRIS